MPDLVNLNAAIDAFEETAYGADARDGVLSHERSMALKAFAGENIEPAKKGRSQVVDRSVFETVQWMMPSFMRIFCGSAKVVEFEPFGEEDEAGAEQESEHLNYRVKQKTDWDLVCRTWFQDACLTKNAYCMAYIDEVSQVEVEQYDGQTEIQIAALTEEGHEILAADARTDEDNQQPVIDPLTGQPVIDEFGQPVTEPVILYDVEVRQTKKKKVLCFQALPPENCRVADTTRDFTLKNCDYFEYFEYMTISELRGMGFDVPDDIADEGYNDSEEDQARDRNLETDLSSYRDYNRPDPSMREVRVRTIWIRHDYDEDGIAEMQKVIRVGSEILTEVPPTDESGNRLPDPEAEGEFVPGKLAIYPATRIPAASIVPFINTHRHMGIAVADLIFEVQRIRTALLRSGLDSMYLATDPRHAASKRVNLDDLLLSKLGGIVQVDTDNPDVAGHVAQLRTENTFPMAQQGLEYTDQMIESRVGVNRMFQGIDSSNLNDYDRVGQLSTMAAQRIEDIARIFAQGVKELFSIAHELLIKSGYQKESVKLRGEWVDIDPTTWRTGRDMRIVAPFAAGNKDSLLQRLLVVANIHEKALAGGLPIVDANDSYELGLAIADAADLPGEKFFTDPATIAPKPPPPDYNGMLVEIENKKADNEALDEQRKAELDKYKTDIQAEVDIAVAQIRAGQAIDVEQLKAAQKADLESFREESRRAAQSNTDRLISRVEKLEERLGQ